MCYFNSLSFFKAGISVGEVVNGAPLPPFVLHTPVSSFSESGKLIDTTASSVIKTKKPTDPQQQQQPFGIPGASGSRIGSLIPPQQQPPQMGMRGAMVGRIGEPPSQFQQQPPQPQLEVTNEVMREERLFINQSNVESSERTFFSNFLSSSILFL